MFEEQNKPKLSNFDGMAGDFNVKVIPVSELRMERNSNGYFLAAGFWSTCFLRIARNKDFFQILSHARPKCAHTYTKIPQMYAHCTYFVYVNFQAGFTIFLPDGAKIVGMDEAQTHLKNSSFKSQSVLVYSPSGPPKVRHSYVIAPSDEVYFCFESSPEVVRSADIFTTANHKQPYFFHPEK